MKIDPPNLWAVTDPTPQSALIDICWQVETYDNLAYWFAGGMVLQATSGRENLALYTTEAEARADALNRLGGAK